MAHTEPCERETVTQQLIQHDPDDRSNSSSNSSSNGLDVHKMRPASAKLSQGSLMTRFYTRSIVLVFIPPLVAAYFVVIWLVLLRKGADPAVRYAYISELWVYYLWFVICTFGIGWSKYGLAGVEVAMLQSRRFSVVDKETLYMHSGNSWSGPDGWIGCLGRLLQGKKSKADRLWYLLSALSLLPFVALPISGLCMELTDGYIYSSAAPMVIGRRWEDFNNRQPFQTTTRARSRWETGASANLPGIGILYTPPYTRRDQITGLHSLPNSFPLEELAPELFVGPQAKTPIDGHAWGLHVGYDCSIVRDASEFTIISNRSKVANIGRGSYRYTRGQSTDVEVSVGSLDNTVYVSNSSIGDPLSSFNLFAYMEMAVSNSSDPAYDGTQLSSVNVLELAIWQARKEAAYREHPFDVHIDVPVQGMGQPFIQLPNGTLTSNRTFLEAYGTLDHVLDDIVSPVDSVKFIYLAPPIGLRCTRLSALGFADVSAKTSSFHNFTKTAPPDFNWDEEEAQAPLFGYTVRNILRRQYLRFYDSINLAPPITVSNSVFYRGFLQAEELRRSVMLAHALDALQLMYDGVSSLGNAYSNPNLTSSRSGRVLIPGVIPAIFPAVFFLIWAGACLILGVRYGFVRRCSDTLDRRCLFELDKPDQGCV
ncbi:uncharacterized protein BO80DRAFT_440749 [Aspergillus ibericus CBS 121593]|uniref:Transmembrane protein n=1 Tax=Aspergillus ibericus CBS 121593 TaxID=1448316 RepID=A0A395HDG4_9EURO|nr:hypothetical protein BO80DRAFT_440749 [Aspergillus ibericus CBS 121593]RAL06021.1 hypothetical protein BO80DRAFT_440749 [Aspergillus ibericus CBS 121593]